MQATRSAAVPLAIHNSPVRSSSVVVILVLVATCLFLVATNLATLMSERAHTAAYGGLKSALSMAVAETALSRLLAASPTVRRAQTIDAATKTLRVEKAALAASTAALERRHSALDQSHRELTSKHSELIRKSATRAEAVKVASKRLAARAASSAARSFSTVGAKAIPVMGVSILVASVAWDLKDACDTLKDLNDVSAAFEHEPVNQAQVCGFKVPSAAEVKRKATENWKRVYQQSAEVLNAPGAGITVPLVQE
jgi:hypothetical protein